MNPHNPWHSPLLLRPAIGLLILLVPAGDAAAASETLANPSDLPIPDTGVWVSSPITSSGITAEATVTGIDVSFSCIHPNGGDLVVELRADSVGALGSMTLWNSEGEGVGDPSRTVTGISTFDDLSPNRTWYLSASDLVAENSGAIDEWTLTVYYDVPCDVVVHGIPGVTPNPVAAGQSITVSYTIRNDGPADATATQTKIQIKDSGGAQLTNATFSDPAIAAEETTDRSAAVLIPEGTPNGSYTVFVILDNLSELHQPSPSNDVAPAVGFTVDGSRCDIVVADTPQISPNAVTAGQSINVEYAIWNNGPADAGETETMIEIKNSSGTVLTTSTVSDPAIPAGGASDENASIAIPAGTSPGTYTARILLDSLGQLSQTSEVNDLSDPAFFVVKATANEINAPDLATTGAPVVNPSMSGQGDTFTAEFAVQNIGSETSLPTAITVEMVNFWGGIITSQTVGIGAVLTGSSSGTLAVDLQVPGSTPSGVYSIRYVINAAGQRQTNYCNDFSAAQTLRVSPSGPVAAGELVEGVDVSHHEGAIDWVKVRLAGKEFAYIKATEGGTAEGYETHPEFFAENWTAAVQAGLAVGAYHFATPLRSPAWHNPAWSEPAAGVKEEAARFVEAARPALKPGFLPPGLDIEPHAVSYVWNPLTLSFDIDPAVGMLDPLDIMGAEALARWIHDWCVEVERLSGTKPIIYMTKSYSTAMAPYLGHRHNLWLAAISDAAGQPDSSEWGSWQIHQYDWFGTITPGISDYVDLNVMQGPLSDRLIKNAKLVSRSRFKVDADEVCIEVAGARCQRVPIQGSTDLTTWFDVAEITLVNGCGELLYPTGSAPQHFFRIGP